MLKRIYFVALTIALCTIATAAPIDQQTALAKAKAFVAERGVNMQLDGARARRAPRLSGDGSEASYYVFNAEGENNGFVIVAGNDLLEPILGYSDSGSLDPENMPEALKALLKTYDYAAEQVSELELEEPVATTRRKVRRTMARPRHYVAPFVTKHWAHKAPYYSMNPVINDSICPVGCTTVGLAQVMGYYEYPDIMPATLSYTTTTRELKMKSLAKYQVDWQNMLSDYSLESYDSIQQAAVSRLMLHLGCGLRSDYDTGSTSASCSLSPIVLRACGYKCSAYTSYMKKSQEEWEDIFFDDMTCKRPVIVAASNVVKDGAAHVYLIDGYDMDDLWHIDWGWGEQSNGFYRLSNLSPYHNTNSYAYMYNTCYIYNIEPNPDGKASTATSVANYDCLTTTSLTLEETGDIIITRGNYTGAKRQFKQGLGLVDDNGQLVRVLSSETATYASKALATGVWNVTDISGYRNGHLRAYPVSQIVGGDGQWHFDICTAENACVNVDITNGEFVLSAAKALVLDSLAVDSTLGFPVGAARKLELNVTNNKMNEHSQWLYLFEDTLNMDFQIIHVPPMSKIKHDFLYIPTTQGEHTVTLCADSGRTQVLFEKQFKIGKSVTYSLECTSWSIDNYVKSSSSSYFYGDKLRMRFTLKNTGKNDYNDFVRPLLATDTWYDTNKIWAHIPVGESREFEFTSDLLKYGVSYTMRVYIKSSSHSNANILNTLLVKISLKPRRGICWWDKNGVMTVTAPISKTYTVPEEAIAVSFEGLSTVPRDFVPNDNPNTLYYLTKDYSSLPTQNKIIDGVAELIHLSDSNSVFVPMDFKADSIVYTRTFDKGFTGKRNGNNWSTLALPFSPSKIFNTVDSVEVDWFHPGDTEGKNFWLRRYVGEEGFYAYFADADTLLPNTPYIITVPDSYKGEEYALVNKPLEFSATDADVRSGKIFEDTPHFNFVGSLSDASFVGDYIFCLNEENGGNSFIYRKDVSETKPFRAYFATPTQPHDGAALYVASYVFQPEDDDSNQSDGIIELAAPISPSWPAGIGIYNLSGVKVATVTDGHLDEALSALPKGIYVVNGKKFLKN